MNICRGETHKISVHFKNVPPPPPPPPLLPFSFFPHRLTLLTLHPIQCHRSLLPSSFFPHRLTLHPIPRHRLCSIVLSARQYITVQTMARINTLIILIWCLLLTPRTFMRLEGVLMGVSAGKIRINDASDITEKKHIDMYVPSYPVVVVGNTASIGMFEENFQEAFRSMVKKGVTSHQMLIFNRIRIHIRRYIYIHTFIHTYMRAYVRTFIHTHMKTHIHTYRCIYLYVHAFARTYTIGHCPQARPLFHSSNQEVFHPIIGCASRDHLVKH